MSELRPEMGRPAPLPLSPLELAIVLFAVASEASRRAAGGDLFGSSRRGAADLFGPRQRR